MQPRPFAYTVPEDALTDLMARLKRARFPDTPPVPAWELGTDTAYMRDLVAYWRDEFDWRAQEAELNAFPQIKLQIADVDMHALHVPGRGPKPRPLLLLHGWPGSIFEFLDIIPRLTDPQRFGGDAADAFTVIAPSLPGYGLSFTPGQARMGCEEMAERVFALMSALGYDRFFVQGGDWGAFVSSRMAFTRPERILGLHLNLLPLRRDLTVADAETEEERTHYASLAAWLRDETGYQAIQGTKPQTLAFALADSPLGLAAWMVEKFHSWADCGGVIETAVPRDRMLANICLYWFTGATGASFHPYYARLRRPWPIPPGGTISVPMGHAVFPTEMVRPPRSLAQKLYTDIRRWSVMPRGGHFAALEQPQMLAEDIFAFVREI